MVIIRKTHQYVEKKTLRNTNYKRINFGKL